MSVRKPEKGSRGSAAFIILFLFVLSGAAGLVYEIIWTRMLSLVFGNTVYAASTVVSSFMGGLALGSYLSGKLIDKRSDVLRIYAFLEAGIALFAILMPFILDGLNLFYGHLFRSLGERPTPFFIARFLLSFLLLIAPSMLMGATLPVLTRFFATERKRIGRQVANLYALNTFGATLGCFAAGFFLIEKLGVTASNYAAAGTSLVVAVLIFLTARTLPPMGRTRSDADSPNTRQGAGEERSGATRGGWDYSSRIRNIVLAGTALAGFASLAYEVLWTRVIVYIVTASIEAFAVVLTTFLAGIAIGSLLVARWVDRWKRPVALLGMVEIAIGLAAVASIPLMANLYKLPAFFLPHLPTGFWGGTAMKFIAAAFVMAVPTLLMGAAFPIATRCFIRDTNHAGSGVGRLYAMNTLGAVAGSAIAGFVILPLMGAQHGILAVAALNIVIGLVLYAAEPGRPVAGAATAALVGAAGVLAGVFLVPANAFHKLFNQSRSQTEMIYCSEGVTATVTVHRFPAGTNLQDDLRVICTNGVDVAGTDYMLRTTQLLQGHLPLLFHKPSPRVMQVGFGSGETARVVLLEGAASLDVIEICEGLMRAAPYFADINEHSYEDPRTRVIIMDAKNYALLTGETYDIIMNDSIHPRVSGNASLYTVDYFADCRRRIAPGGFMSSWFPVYGMREEEMKMILRSFQTVFPHATLWMAHNVVNRHAQLLAPVDDTPLTIDFQDFYRRINDPAIQKDLVIMDAENPYFFLNSLVMDEDAMREYTEGAKLNTDDHPLLEYITPKFTEADELGWATLLESMLPYRSDVRNLLYDLPTDSLEREETLEKLGRYYESNEYALRGMIKGLRGDPTSREEFDKAEEICPEHPAVRLARERRERMLEQQEQLAMQNPDDPRALTGLARTYWRNGRLEEAARKMDAAARLAPDDAGIARWQGDLRHALADDRRAVESYRRALELAPERSAALLGLAVSLEAMGDLDGAADACAKAADITGDRSDVLLRLGLLEEKRGRVDDAAEAYRAALEKDPLSVDALNFLAVLEGGRGNLAEAESLCRRAIAAAPKNSEAYNNLAWMFGEKNTNLDEALDLAKRAVELDPSASRFDTLAWVHYKRNETVEAKEAILKAIDLAPENETYVKRLATIELATNTSRADK